MTTTQTQFPVELLRAPLHESLLGESLVITEARSLISRLAKSDLTVLITGESGTGKDIAARLLHRLSTRSTKPFIKLNCPAIPESLLESELFGHERGAFTGARASKPGRLELAHTGTMFLDEVAECSYAVQGKLLQVLDGEPIMRIGGVTPIECDVRILAATNISLEEAVRSGRMREDVFFRLSEVTVHMPPLRDRPEDVPLLAEHFNYNFCIRAGRGYKPIDGMLLLKMRNVPWRGNVRELASCVRKYVTTSDPDALLGEDNMPTAQPPRSSALIQPSSIIRTAILGKPRSNEVDETPPSTPAPQPRAPQFPLSSRTKAEEKAEPRVFPSLREATRKAVETAEVALIEEVLRYTFWNRRKAAKLLAISYSSLLRRINAHNIGANEIFKD